jgi:hypothetical protein
VKRLQVVDFWFPAIMRGKVIDFTDFMWKSPEGDDLRWLIPAIMRDYQFIFEQLGVL